MNTLYYVASTIHRLIYIRRFQVLLRRRIHLPEVRESRVISRALLR
jgi:hypothetical protein